MSTQSTSRPPQLPRIAGLPAELWLVVALFAATGAYLAIWVLVEVVPEMAGLANWLGFRLMLFVLLPYLLILLLGVGLVAIAWLMWRRSRIARGLAYMLLAATLVSTLVLSNESSSGVISESVLGSGVALTVVLFTVAAAAILAISPAVREHFTGADAPASDQPTSVTVARVLLIMVASTYAVVAVLYFLVVDLLPTDGIVVGVVSGVIAGVGAVVASRLAAPDRVARLAITVVAGAALVLVLVVGESVQASIIPACVMVAIPFALWIPPDARLFFGDPPIGAVTGTTQSSRTPRPAPRMPAVESAVAGGITPSGTVVLSSDGAAAIGADEIDLGLVACHIVGGWIAPGAHPAAVDIRSDGVFANSPGSVRLSNRRMIIAADMPPSAAENGAPSIKVCASVPLEALQVAHIGDAVALGLRDRRGSGWIRLSGDAADRALILRVVHVAAARRLQLRPRDTRRPQLEGLHHGGFDRTADLGGEFHLWEAFLAYLASASKGALPAAAAQTASAPDSTLSPTSNTGKATESRPITVLAPGIQQPAQDDAATPTAEPDTAVVVTPELSPVGEVGGQGHCESCGALFTGDDRFCTICGSPRSA